MVKNVKLCRNRGILCKTTETSYLSAPNLNLQEMYLASLDSTPLPTELLGCHIRQKINLLCLYLCICFQICKWIDLFCRCSVIKFSHRKIPKINIIIYRNILSYGQSNTFFLSFFNAHIYIAVLTNSNSNLLKQQKNTTIKPHTHTQIGIRKRRCDCL